MIEIIVTLIAGIVVTIIIERLYTRWRADAADYELWVDVEDLSLMPEDTDRFETGIQYFVEGQLVEKPHVVEVDVWTAGVKDVRTDMFHADRPIQINLNVPIVKELKGSREYAAEATEFALDMVGVVGINPSLIRQGMVKRYRLLTDGKPDLTWDSQVADLHLCDLSQEWETPTLDRKIARVVARVLTAVLIVTVFFLMLSAFLPEEVSKGIADAVPEPGPWLLLSGLIVPFLFGLFAYGANASRRPRQALKVLKRGLSLAPRTSSEPLVRHVTPPPY